MKQALGDTSKARGSCGHLTAVDHACMRERAAHAEAACNSLQVRKGTHVGTAYKARVRSVPRMQQQRAAPAVAACSACRTIAQRMPQQRATLAEIWRATRAVEIWRAVYAGLACNACRSRVRRMENQKFRSSVQQHTGAACSTCRTSMQRIPRRVPPMQKCNACTSTVPRMHEHPVTIEEHINAGRFGLGIWV